MIYMYIKDPREFTLFPLCFFVQECAATSLSRKFFSSELQMADTPHLGH